MVGQLPKPMPKPPNHPSKAKPQPVPLSIPKRPASPAPSVVSSGPLPMQGQMMPNQMPNSGDADYVSMGTPSAKKVNDSIFNNDVGVMPATPTGMGSTEGP